MLFRSRYQDVAALSAEVEAYQGGFATMAEQAGALKQLLLLMRRHRAVTALLAVLLLVSLGFVLKVLAGERRAGANEQRANAATAVVEPAKDAARRARAGGRRRR